MKTKIDKYETWRAVYIFCAIAIPILAFQFIYVEMVDMDKLTWVWLLFTVAGGSILAALLVNAYFNAKIAKAKPAKPLEN